HLPGMATSLEVCAEAIKEFRADAIATPMTILKIAKKPGWTERSDFSQDDFANAVENAIAGSDAPPPGSRRRRRRAVRTSRGKFGVTAADREFFSRGDREAPDDLSDEVDGPEPPSPP